ncbi:MAG TPA: CYTH domain-containing protein [Candidatus Binatia bacterium]|nr:CYTH domain-containing protein [Candidatus Binatia bacterium]
MKASGGEPIEVEVKVGVRDARAIRALLRSPDPARLAGFTADGPLESRQITDRYLDTAPSAGRLELGGYRARLRRRAVAVELTLKRRGVEDGSVTTRLELTGPATRSRNPGAWPTSDARDLLVELAGPGRLVEVAALRQRRLVRNLRRGPTVVEASLDALEALDGPLVRERRWELELELVEGERDDLADLAAAVLALPAVEAAAGSKLEFARGARGGATPASIAGLPGRQQSAARLPDPAGDPTSSPARGPDLGAK